MIFLISKEDRNAEVWMNRVLITKVSIGNFMQFLSAIYIVILNTAYPEEILHLYEYSINFQHYININYDK